MPLNLEKKKKNLDPEILPDVADISQLLQRLFDVFFFYILAASLSVPLVVMKVYLKPEGFFSPLFPP